MYNGLGQYLGFLPFECDAVEDDVAVEAEGVVSVLDLFQCVSCIGFHGLHTLHGYHIGREGGEGVPHRRR